MFPSYRNQSVDLQSWKLEVGTKVSPFDKKDISESVRLRLVKFTTFLLTKLPCNLLSNIFAALSFIFNLSPIELAFTSCISTKLSFSRSFSSLTSPPIYFNVKDNVNWNKTFTKIKKYIH